MSLQFISSKFKHMVLTFFLFVFPCIITLYYIKNQLGATLAVLFISHCKITLHVSASSTVVNTPDDGRRKRPKHVE